MKINTGGSSITTDGLTCATRSFSIIGHKVVIDGVEQVGMLVGLISVTVNGNDEPVKTGSAMIGVTGYAGLVKTISSDVHCGDVQGDVGTIGGDIACGVIAGSAKTLSGDMIERR